MKDEETAVLRLGNKFGDWFLLFNPTKLPRTGALFSLFFLLRLSSHHAQSVMATLWLAFGLNSVTLVR
jgi:hypothetical protein